MLNKLKSIFTTPKPTGPAEVIRWFNSAEATITKDCTIDGDAWLFNSDQPQTFNLFEIENPGVEQCILVYRAQIRTEGVDGRTYLEMWCRFKGKGEFFSKGFNQALSGTNEWTKKEIPFFLKQGQMPETVKLNLVIEGKGKVWVKDIELLKTPIE